MTVLVRPMCLGCTHFRKEKAGLTCDAFPDGIPDGIVKSRTDHRELVAGDHGIRFEANDKSAADYAASLFKVTA